MMTCLIVTIVEYVDDSQPGWVRCIFKDYVGKEWSIIEKVPIVSAEQLDADSDYPKTGVVACQIVDEKTDADGKKVVAIDTRIPWAVYAEDDETRFDVYADQVEEITLK